MTEPVDAWALQRLAILTRYLCAFTTAWKDRPFSTAYIDAFSGADYCSNDLGDSSRLGGFPALADAPPKALLKCSARVVLATDPAFDGYVFIEQNGRRCRALETLQRQFPDRNIQIKRSDANRELRRISHLYRQPRRAVLFVDAYATNLEWDTIIDVSRTNAIDMWLLFPVGIGSYQPAGKAIGLPPHWRDRLKRLLESDEWFTGFDPSQPPLDGLVETLRQSFRERLKGVFANVAVPRVMRSSSGAPLYLLCFASGAPGLDGRMAVELADHLLESMAADPD